MIINFVIIKNNFNIIILILLLFYSKIIFSADNKIIFKINNKAFTQLDLEKRIEYLDFVSNNENISKAVIIDDFISANLFFEYYTKSYDTNNYSQKILEIYNNILNTNKLNNKKYSYEINKENILDNIQIDFIRKVVLENILNTSLIDYKSNHEEIDLLYKFNIKYINFKINDSQLENRFKNLKKINYQILQIFLKENNIKFFVKEKEINNIQEIDTRIKENILLNNNFFILRKNNNRSAIFIDKNFETFDGIIANLYSVRSKNELSSDFLKCENLMKLNNYANITNKEYKFINLNNDLKNNLININDFVKYLNNEENVYVILCDIKFDKDVLKNLNLNKVINSNINDIEIKFINKYSRIYNLVKFYE